MTTSKDFDQAADWAENDMALKPDSTTALTGDAAAAYGASVLAAAIGRGPEISDYPTPGRPSLGAAGAVGISPSRQARLPKDVSAQLDALAKKQGRKPGAVMRDAVIDYVAQHLAPEERNQILADLNKTEHLGVVPKPKTSKRAQPAV